MEFAELLVNTASKELEGAHDSPFFLAAEIAVAFDLGEFDRAKQRLAEWPESDRSHPYWMWKAIILDEVDGESEQAIVPYQKALEIWPGPMDWRLRFRLAACLTRLQRIEDAEKQRQRAKQIQELLSQERHAKIRDALGYLDDPQRLQVVVEFYNELGRPKEAQAWTEYIQSLRE